MTLTTRSLLGLASGILVGAVISATHNDALQRLALLIEPVGSMWVNALRMTIIPLVFSLLVVGIASAADTGAIGRIGVKAIALFLLLLVAAATFAALAAPPLLGWLTVDPAISESLKAGLDPTIVESARKVPTLAQRLINLVPINPIKAAAEGELLPLIVFAMFFGFASRRLATELRESLVSFFRAISETMLVIIGWVLWLAPLGVFGLVLPLMLRTGWKLVGALSYYVVLLSVLVIIVTLALYLMVMLWARIPLREFIRASLTAQTVAFTTQSSLASLPAMVEGAERRLALPSQVTNLVLPLAVSVFRISNPIAQVCGALFIARLYNLELDAAKLITLIVTSVLLSLSSVGVPGGVSLLVTLPATFVAVGLPIEAIGLLISVEAIPDMFRTTANVTADMAAAAVLGRPAEIPIPIAAASSEA